MAGPYVISHETLENRQFEWEVKANVWQGAMQPLTGGERSLREESETRREHKGRPDLRRNRALLQRLAGPTRSDPHRRRRRRRHPPSCRVGTRPAFPEGPSARPLQDVQRARRGAQQQGLVQHPDFNQTLPRPDGRVLRVEFETGVRQAGKAALAPPLPSCRRP